MIQKLRIQGLAIIDSLEIEFSHGFNVITGETGAGKSILIRALSLLTGAKASPDSVRKGFDAANVAGEFLMPSNHKAPLFLSNLGIPIEESAEGCQLIVRRQVASKGRSQAWINDVPVTTQTLRELGSVLLDVFAQHENQRLLDSSSHLAYVDGFLKDRSALIATEQKFHECQNKMNSIREKLQSFRDRHKNHDYLAFRWEVLQKFAPASADFQEVRDLCDRAESQVKYRDALLSATQYLSLEDGGESIARRVRESAKILSRIEGNQKISELATRAEEMAVQLDDLHYEVDRLTSDVDLDESSLQTAQERLYGYQDLFRKHGVSTVEALLEEYDKLKSEIEFLESANEQLAADLSALETLTTDLFRLATTLSEQRKKAAKVVKNRVEAELHELAMPGCRFEIAFEPVERHVAELELTEFDGSTKERWQRVSPTLSSVSSNGIDALQFFLATNPGEPLLALDKTVSGGELSRIMLAFKKALAVDAETCVLVFDEIDTGISGRVADVVGRKMQELAEQFQVICISHLPQVAVYAESHFMVKKEGSASRTETRIVRLTQDQSAKEIARLLSGEEVSNPSLANAKLLIAKAKKKRRDNSATHRGTST